MKTTLRCAAILLLILSVPLLLHAQELGPPVAERILPRDGYMPGEPFAVRINATGEPGPLTVVEFPPTGWPIEESTWPRGATISAGAVTWDLPSFDGSETFSYQLTPPRTARDNVVFSGQIDGLEIGGATTLSVPTPQPGQQVRVPTAPDHSYVYEYLYLPAQYGQEEKTWPLIMFLHGKSVSATYAGIPTFLQNVERYTELMPEVLNQLTGFVVVSPQCPRGDWWDNEYLVEVLDDVISTYSIDPSRVYLTGPSMGGYSTWSLASAYPDRFAAIAPVCGGWRYADPAALVDIPAWAFHGDADDTVPLSNGESIVNAVRELGGDVKFTVYPGVGHAQCSTIAYRDPELYTWFLQHSKEVAPSTIGDWAHHH